MSLCVVTTRREWSPDIDVFETKDSYVIKADLPGLTKEDLSVSVEDDSLIIKGEKSSENKSEEDGILRQERSYGRFQRSFTLPRNVEGKQLKASYKNGVLEVTLPKGKEDQTNQIDIDVE